MNERIVLYLATRAITPVTQVDFLFLPTTNLFVAFITNFLADQNVMSCVRVNLTLHLSEKTLGWLLIWNMNLNGIINIFTDDWQGRSKTIRFNLLSLIKKATQTTQYSIIDSVWVQLLCSITYNKIPTKDGVTCIWWELRFRRLISFFFCRNVAKGRAW